MMKLYLSFNTVTTKPAYEANGFVSVCKIKSDIKMDS